MYEDKRVPQTRLSAAAGFDRDEVKVVGITYDEMRDGCYDPKARLEDMDVNHVEASLCFPSFPRFCGQTFMEADDKDLAKLCVEAYNDWMVDEWCGGSGGRLIPLCIIPLWDAELAAAEVRRNAERGVRAVCFSEIPPYLGLPSVHDADGYWEPFVQACEETDTVINMHIGSSSKMPSTSADAPAAVGSTLTFNNAMASMSDWLFSGLLEKFPEVKIAYSEGQIGWIPYILERADKVWEDNRAWGGVADKVPEPPSTYYFRQMYGCFFDDEVGLEMLDRGRRRQRHLRDRLPALRLDVAPHQGGGPEAHGPPARRRRSASSCGATPSRCCRSTSSRRLDDSSVGPRPARAARCRRRRARRRRRPAGRAPWPHRRSGWRSSAPGTPATAPPMRAASIVVGGVRSTALPTTAGWMTLFSMFW